LLETQNGFMWVGTDQGLFRYDGLEFDLYPLSDSLATAEKASALYETPEGQLWVGYEDGRIAYSDQLRPLKLWDIEEGHPVVPITGFSKDAQGNFWIATYGEGLYYHNGRHLYNFDTADGLLGNDIYCLALDQSGRLWAGTDHGISICSIEAGKKTLINLRKEDGLPDDIIRAILPDGERHCWLGGYDNGFVRMDTEDFTVEVVAEDWKHGAISTFALFPDKELWIGTESEGAFRYDLHTKHLSSATHRTEKSKVDRIYDLHRDDEGNIWMINNSIGVCSANRQFESLKLNIPSVQAVLETDDQRLWLGTTEGLYVYDLRSGNLNQPIEQHNIVSLYEDQRGNIWAGTFGEGLICYRPMDEKIRYLKEQEGISNNSILSIAGNKGAVWLATLGGVTEIVEENIMDTPSPLIRKYTHRNGLGTNFIYSVFVDSRGRTWFGTDGKGLCLLDKGDITNYTSSNGHEFKSVYSITEDGSGNIWFSTAREGIFKFDGETFNHLDVKEGIRDLEISGITADNNGNILLVHSSGIDILDPQLNHLIYYDQEVGLETIVPNLNAIGTSKNGNIWFGTQDRVIKYTQLTSPVSIHPKTIITRVAAQLQSIPLGAPPELAHHQNSLIFEYVGLWYTDPATVKYRYQLEGFDGDWIYSRDRTATYSSLPPGSYNFLISSTENDSFNQEPIVSYQFRIKAPVWRRPWFIILAVLGLSLLALSIIRAREKQIEREAYLQREKAISQLETLKSQVNPHFLFNSFNTLTVLIEEDSETAVEYVEKLSDFYRSILQYREQSLISVEEEMKIVEAYFFLLQKRYGKNIILLLDVNGHTGKIVPLTLQILVENAVKHNIISSSKPLTISISTTHQHIIVNNNLQPKLTRERSTGFGLQSIQNHYGMITHKKVEVTSDNGYFEVRIPLLETQIKASL
jgi:ligand-binding sensor domain-containing protein